MNCVISVRAKTPQLLRIMALGNNYNSSHTVGISLFIGIYEQNVFLITPHGSGFRACSATFPLFCCHSRNEVSPPRSTVQAHSPYWCASFCVPPGLFWHEGSWHALCHPRASRNKRQHHLWAGLWSLDGVRRQSVREEFSWGKNNSYRTTVTQAAVGKTPSTLSWRESR